MTADVVTSQLERALVYARGTHTAADVLAAAERGEVQIWAPWPDTPGAGIVVTEIKKSGRVTYLHFWLAAGDHDSLIPIIKTAMSWGKAHGCVRASFIGRMGWARSWARDFGFKVTGVSMETDEL